MSDSIVRSIGELAAETAVEVAWAQWSALTTTASADSDTRVESIIDPEALILLSLALRDRERRLDDLLAGWASAASPLLSIQRLKTLAKSFPQNVAEQLPAFARYAAEAGDRRWRAHAADRDDAPSATPRTKDVGPLRLLEGPSLMLRLRAGIGVGAKADLLSVLLGLGGAEAGLKEITLAAAYSERAIRATAYEMAMARFIDRIEGSPTTYRADPDAWGRVLDTSHLGSRATSQAGVPPWRFWWVAFAFLTAVINWEREARREGWSIYVASSRARDLVEMHRRQLRYTDAAVGAAQAARGEEYLEVFREIVETVAAWARRSLGAE